MRYLGGKAKLAKHIAEAIHNEVLDEPIWEPFCGGLSVTVELAKRQRSVLATDHHPALISLYQALWDGWVPPTMVDSVAYENARSLPDWDPLKGFIGFGVSFAGKYFAGFARGEDRNFADESARCLVQQFEVLRGRAVSFRQQDFFDVKPTAGFGHHIYADPPYANTTGYRANPREGAEGFDSERFWSTCLDWVRCGVRVFVSEFVCPVPHAVLWSVRRALSVDKDGPTTHRVDSLYEVLLEPREEPPDIWALIEAADT